MPNVRIAAIISVIDGDKMKIILESMFDVGDRVKFRSHYGDIMHGVVTDVFVHNNEFKYRLDGLYKNCEFYEAELHSDKEND